MTWLTNATCVLDDSLYSRRSWNGYVSWCSLTKWLVVATAAYFCDRYVALPVTVVVEVSPVLCGCAALGP